jgi:hypothetical protein
MRTIDEYFAGIRRLIQAEAGVYIERYEEQILTSNRGNLRIRLKFADKSLLEISEAIVLIGEEPRWLSYRYHYQSPPTGLIFRYDNAPHRPEISSRPEHKHTQDSVAASPHPSLEELLEEAQAFRVGGASRH